MSLRQLEGEIDELRERISNPEKEKLTLSQFLNLSKQAENKVKSGTEVQKDTICRIIFLNLTVDEEEVLSYQAKEPFATMLKTRQSTSSRG